MIVVDQSPSLPVEQEPGHGPFACERQTHQDTPQSLPATKDQWAQTSRTAFSPTPAGRDKRLARRIADGSGLPPAAPRQCSAAMPLGHKPARFQVLAFLLDSAPPRARAGRPAWRATDFQLVNGAKWTYDLIGPDLLISSLEWIDRVLPLAAFAPPPGVFCCASSAATHSSKRRVTSPLGS